jgi:hypothetical protein
MKTFKMNNRVAAGLRFPACLPRPLMVAETKSRRQVTMCFDTGTFRFKIYTALFATLTAGMLLLALF